MRFLATLILCFSFTVWNASVRASQDGFVTRDVVAFDRYRNVSRKEEKKRLDNFAEPFRRDPKAKGYIIVYAGRPSRLGMARVRARRALDYLINNCGSDPKRIVSVALDSSLVNELTVELWVLPEHAAAVVHIPGVDPSDLRSKKVFTIKGTEIRKRRSRK